MEDGAWIIYYNGPGGLNKVAADGSWTRENSLGNLTVHTDGAWEYKIKPDGTQSPNTPGALPQNIATASAGSSQSTDIITSIAVRADGSWEKTSSSERVRVSAQGEYTGDGKPELIFPLNNHTTGSAMSVSPPTCHEDMAFGDKNADTKTPVTPKEPAKASTRQN